MNLPETIRSISERIQTAATVKTVYGEPIEVEGKTIIPVARVRYGFGGGGGTAEISPRGEGGEPGSAEGEAAKPSIGSGGGGGGGVEISPVGIIEITESETRFISFEDRRRAIRAGLIALLLGMFLWWRRRRG